MDAVSLAVDRERLHRYLERVFFWTGVCTIPIFGVGLVLLVFVRPWHRRCYVPRWLDALRYGLTDHELIVVSGVWWRSEVRIPLGQIRSITLSEGPLMRRCGVKSLVIRISGHIQNSPADAELQGLVDPEGAQQMISERIAARRAPRAEA